LLRHKVSESTLPNGFHETDMIIADSHKKRRRTSRTPSTSEDSDSDSDGEAEGEEEEEEEGFLCDTEDSGSETEYVPGSSDESGSSDVSHPLYPLITFCPVRDVR
jgi:hypothetical protein